MVSKRIYFIYRPSPTFARSPIQGAGGGLFGFYKEDKYIAVLQDYLNKKISIGSLYGMILNQI